MMSGLFVPAGLLTVSISEWAYGPIESQPSWVQGLAFGSLLCFLLANRVLLHLTNLGRWMATLGVLAPAGLAVGRLSEFPALALVMCIVLISALAEISRLRPVLPLDAEEMLDARAHGMAIGTVTAWLYAVYAVDPRSVLWWTAVPLCMLVATFGALRWALRHRRTGHIGPPLLFGLAVVSWSVLLWTAVTGTWSSSVGIFVPVAASFLLRKERTVFDPGSWLEPVLARPERVFVATFAGLCTVGTFLLALPQSSASGHGISLIDAAFTAVSAVCVTGLVVLDTAKDFSGFGQVMILLLIQTGGLGIMTFSALALWAFRRRIGLRSEGALAALVSPQDRGRLYDTTRRIVAVTFFAELTGAVILALVFSGLGDSPGMAIWRGLFTAVSAFCNAGFGLQTDSLIGYANVPVVLHVVALLIIFGGLSPLMLGDIPAIFGIQRHPVKAQSKLALSGTLALLMAGFLSCLTFEWSHTLATMSFWDKVHNAWFSSVTYRTAGFNSIDYVQATEATLTVAMVLMFIGGSPGGTAGGIKTTTAAILLLSVGQIVRGRARLEVFGRHISESSRLRALVSTILAAGTVLVALVALQLTQDIPTVSALFEVISALGTVGLSIGATAALDEVGKLVIMGCMFMGRVGGVSLLMFLSQKPTTIGVLTRPEEEVEVG